jgi:WD40 repeat protein/serine/threonine protein kinase
MDDSHALDEQLLQRLPLPLAQLCRRSQNAKTPLERHLTAYYLWEAALKLLGVVAVVEYAELKDQDAELTDKLKNLARPSIGHWWEFVRRLIPVLADNADAGFAAARELLLGRARDDLPRAAGLYAALTEALEGQGGARSTVRLTELFDRLVTYRNREIGHGAAGQKAGEFYQRMGSALLAGLLQILGKLDVLAGRRLVYVADVRRVASGGWLVEAYSLLGETARRLEPWELPAADTRCLPRPECVYLEGGRDPHVGVPFPLLRPLHLLVHYDAEAGKLFFLNARRGKKQIEYLCYSTGEVQSRESTGQDQCELLARVLGRPVDASSAESWAGRSLADEPAGEVAMPAAGARSVGEFELLSRLGQGGMGVVYRAWQPSLGRQVALKCMLRSGDPKAEARFAREIRALGRMEHPNVVKVFTSGADGDQWFYAMELIEGAELARVCEQLAGSSAPEVNEDRWHQALSRACEQARSQETVISTTQPGSLRPAARAAVPGGVSPAAPASTSRPSLPQGGRGHIGQMVEIIRQVAQAVHALNEAGVVHRDIKPGNIMLTADGAHPVLMDLGLAQLADETDGRLTRTRQFVGTLRYASPEQVLAAGQVDRRTDVYSLGATLWELLTLRPIYGGNDDMATPELMLKIQTADPESPRKHNRNIPRDLEAIVMKCLEKDRTRRYAAAGDLADDLGRFLQGAPVSAQPASLTYLTGKLVRRYRVPLAVAGMVLVLLLGSAVAAFVGIDRQRRAALDANDKLQEQLYRNRIAVAERELTNNDDVGLASDLLEQCPVHLRGWEWDYLMRLRDGPRAPLRGHDGGLWAAEFSPDGRRVVTGSVDGTAKIWDTATGRLLLTFNNYALRVGIGPRVPVTCLAWSPDGQHIISPSLFPNPVAPLNAREAFGVVKVWDATTGQVKVQYDKQVGIVYCLAVSPDGKRVASSSVNDEKSFAVWDARTGEEIRVIRGNSSHLHRIRYSPDGRFLAAGCTDGTVKIWDANTLELLRTLDAHRAPVYGLAFSPDSVYLGTAGFDSTVGIWETATGAPVRTLRGHTGAAMGVAFSPDGRRVASSGYDKTVRVWDAATGEEKITLRGHTELVSHVAFSPDGWQILSASFDKEARIWDASPLDESGASASGALTLQGHTDRVNAIAFSPDGRLLASGGFDNTVRLWDAQAGRALRTLEGHTAAIWGVAFSPDSKHVASGSWDRTVKIWDAQSGRQEFTFTGHATPAHCVAFSPDGRRLVSTSWEGLVKVWDPNNGKEHITYSGHLFPTVGLAHSPDGKRVASGSGDRTVRVWLADSGRDVFTLRGHAGAVAGVAYSPDGKRIASASWDHTARIWDAKTGKELLTLTHHTDRVHCVAFSPDGTRLATASEDKTVRVWDTATGQEVLPPRYHRGVVGAVAFSPDGKRLAAGCWTSFGYVRLWNNGDKSASTSLK